MGTLKPNVDSKDREPDAPASLNLMTVSCARFFLTCCALVRQKGGQSGGVDEHAARHPDRGGRDADPAPRQGNHDALPDLAGTVN